jgi:hypothetical protein
MTQSREPDEICSATVRKTKRDLAGKAAVLLEFLDRSGNPFNWLDIALGLCESSNFRDLWHKTWADIPFDFQWKPVPIHPSSATTKPFFVVVVPASFPKSNPVAFDEHLQKLGENELIADFINLSGDAHLVVPKATGDYGHIATFCRQSPPNLQQAFWTRTGELALEAIQKNRAVWCNTHGHGVPWMHLRFDRTLKYIAFPPSGKIDVNSQTFWYQKIYR